MRHAAFLAVLTACTEYDIAGKESEVEPGTSPECDVPAPAPYVPSLEASCAQPPVVGTFDPAVEWSWADDPILPGFEQIMATPVVAPLVDTNGDGRVDEADRPAVVFTSFSYATSYAGPGAITAVDGDGSTLWSVDDVGGYAPYATSGVAVADLGDGLGPAVLVTDTAGLSCLNADGSARWHADLAPYPYGSPAIGDVDGDGLAEIAYGPTLVDTDGTVLWTGGSGTGGYMSFFANVDQSGDLELVAGSAVYRSDGTVLSTDGGLDGFPAIADLQGDGSPEIVVVAGSAIRAWDALSGAVEWTSPFLAAGGGAPTVADFDGDGLPEVGAANSTYYEVFDGDGARLWSDVVQDFSSAITSSSVFDFEGDGAAEVVYADEQTLWVFDGATGAVEMAWDSHSSGTLLEYPVIVDIDGDDEAEIVVASNDYAFAGSRGITVIGDANGSWVPARRVWNQSAYDITNIRDDGTIPRQETPSFTAWNSFRAGNSLTQTGLDLPDLSVGAPESCLDECADGRVELWVPVENQATRDVSQVELRATDSTGATVASAIVDSTAAGVAWAALEIPVLAWSTGDVELTIDPDDLVHECDEADQTRALSNPCAATTTTP